MDSRASENFLILTQQLDIGVEGIDEDSFNPLSRAFKLLLENGKPMRRAALCFFDPNEGHGYGNDIKWFGVFVHSSGGRLLFFPGLANQERGYTLAGNRNRSDNDFVTDHVTMDREFREIHATNKNPPGHICLGKPGNLGEGRYFWFGMSVQGLGRLRQLKRTTRIQVPVPPTDSNRRIHNIQDARGHYDEVSISDLCMKLAPGSRERFSTGFLYVAVIVGPPGFKKDHCVTSPLGLPFGDPYVSPPLHKELRQVPLRSHNIQLSDEFDLQLVTMQLPGKLGVPISFSCMN